MPALHRSSARDLEHHCLTWQEHINVTRLAVSPHGSDGMKLSWVQQQAQRWQAWLERRFSP